jgi:hypothetical protein
MIKKSLLIPIILISTLVAIYLFSLFQFNHVNSPQQTQLRKVGDECAGISENAVANMTAVVEFQKLEIQGRKINVMRLCMKDHGLVESPDWLVYAQPIATASALKLKISQDEAIENLRRLHMMQFDETPDHPIYWTPHS